MAEEADVTRGLMDREKYDDRAHRLASGRLFELSGLPEKQCTELAREALHTLAADGIVLARWRSDEDGWRRLYRAEDPAGPPAWRDEVVVRYPNRSGAVVTVTAHGPAGMPNYHDAQCAGCLLGSTPSNIDEIEDLDELEKVPRRIEAVRGWADRHAAECRALPQSEA